MWELDNKESWTSKNWCFWTVVLEKTLESPMNCKEIKPINPKEINPDSSLEGLFLKLKLQHYGHLVRTASQIESRKRKGRQGMSLLFNVLSRLVIPFLSRSKHLLISCMQSPSAVILEPKKIRKIFTDGLFPHLFPTKWWGQWSYFKSWKMMLWKSCTQYASKFGKLSSGHRTGKGQFSFQS